MTLRHINKLTYKAILISAAFGLHTITYSQQATAAPAAPSPSAPSNAGPASEGGEYRPMNIFVSPGGHVVQAYEAIRSPGFCVPLFELGNSESNRSQSRFWTQCILGGPINR